MIHHGLRPNRKSVSAVIISAVLLAGLLILSRQPLAGEDEFNILSVRFSDLSVEPSKIPLDVIENLTPPDTVLKGDVIIIPDRQIIRKKTGGGGMIGVVQHKVAEALDMGGETEAAARLKSLWGRDVELREPVVFEDPGRLTAAKLIDQGFVRVDQKVVQIDDGEPYTISRWVRRDDSDAQILGRARGRVVLVPNAHIKSGTDEFLAGFKFESVPEFGLKDKPAGRKAQLQAEEQFEAFRRVFNKRYKRVQEHLNRSRHLMGRLEKKIAQRTGEGENFLIRREIRGVTFFGKPIRVVKVKVLAYIPRRQNQNGDADNDWDN